MRGETPLCPGIKSAITSVETQIIKLRCESDNMLLEVGIVSCSHFLKSLGQLMSSWCHYRKQYRKMMSFVIKWRHGVGFMPNIQKIFLLLINNFCANMKSFSCVFQKLWRFWVFRVSIQKLEFRHLPYLTFGVVNSVWGKMNSYKTS